MEELLASSTIKKPLQVSRNQQVEGEIIAILEKELVLDLGSKSEAILQKRELPASFVQQLKVGDKIKAYVLQPENENGQIVLSSTIKLPPSRSSFRRGAVSLTRFVNAQKDRAVVKGKIAEDNRGGFLIDTGTVRGFIPSSQIGYEIISKIKNSDKGIGEEVSVLVSEVDEPNQKLIFSQKGLADKEVVKELKKIVSSQKVPAQIIATLPFGVIVKLDSTNGIVFANEASWEKIEDLSTIFKDNQSVEVAVLGVDEEFGRLSLSIKQLSKDPFSEILEKYPTDEVVKGEIVSISESGISVALEGIEGFLPAEKKDSSVSYEVGKSMTFLVDGVDQHKRRINLAPFITSTVGLIYK